MVAILTAPAAGSDLPAIWTAIGTIALAVVTVAAIITTIVITRGERQRAESREQLAEACAVQVVMAEKSTGPPGSRTGAPSRLAAVVVNHGRFVISRIEARLRLAGDGSPGLIEFASYLRVPETRELDPRLFGGWDAQFEGMLHAGRLLPWDLGMRFESDPVAPERIPGVYSVVRWTDRWGTRWENRRGEVRKVAKGEPWSA